MPVYFAQAGDGGPVKIGFASNVTARLGKIRVDCPAPLTLLAIADGDTTVESGLHGRFASLRTRGEWFDPAPSLLAFIATLPKPVKPPRKSQYGLHLPGTHPVLIEAVRLAGGPGAVAKELGISREAVVQWKRCPAERAIQLEKLTEGKVTRQQLRSDLYPVEEAAE